jgi:hypothetical protein
MDNPMKPLSLCLFLVATLLTSCSTPGSPTAAPPTRGTKVYSIDSLDALRDSLNALLRQDSVEVQDPIAMRAKWDASGIECYEMVYQELGFTLGPPLVIRVERGAVVEASEVLHDGRLLTSTNTTWLRHLPTVDTLYAHLKRTSTHRPDIFIRWRPVIYNSDLGLPVYATNDLVDANGDWACIDCWGGYMIYSFTPLVCPSE